MRSAVYVGRMAHVRTKPKRNAFSYGIYMLYLDLDEVRDLDRRFKWFSVGRWNLLSFYESDHFTFLDQTDADALTISRENVPFHPESYRGLGLKERVRTLLREAGLQFELGRVTLLTNPRVLGYVFNPVSFYYCFDDKGVFRALLSEVNNTFGDQKMFVCPISDPSAALFTARQDKHFYISPFTEYDNTLTWKFDLPGERTAMLVDSLKGDEAEVKASFAGTRRELSDKVLLSLNLRYPLYTMMVIARIHVQALKLFVKGVRFRAKTDQDAKIVQTLSGKQ